jgi:hypothetical protein
VTFVKGSVDSLLAVSTKVFSEGAAVALTPEWVERVPEVVPGYPERLLPKPGFEAELKKRTLTNLYNARPAWLAKAHEALDAAVAAAYGWHDYSPGMSDEAILQRLLALNLQRSGNAG